MRKEVNTYRFYSMIKVWFYRSTVMCLSLFVLATSVSASTTEHIIRKISVVNESFTTYTGITAHSGDVTALTMEHDGFAYITVADIDASGNVGDFKDFSAVAVRQGEVLLLYTPTGRDIRCTRLYTGDETSMVLTNGVRLILPRYFTVFVNRIKQH